MTHVRPWVAAALALLLSRGVLLLGDAKALGPIGPAFFSFLPLVFVFQAVQVRRLEALVEQRTKAASRVAQ